jgi:prevent-host-death family protein
VKTVNVHEAKTNFSALLAAVQTGETIIICRNGEPVGDLIPHRRVNRTKPHPDLEKIKIKFDPLKPLSEVEWPKAAR